MEYNDLPEAYRDGFKYFLGCKIDLSQRPLIPREETEYWVKGAIEETKKSAVNKKIKCLDLFSGSGCIGISLLKNINEADCDFGEIDDNFLKQIQINLDLNLIEASRYNIIKSDVFSSIIGNYDFIFANPPYVAEERRNEIGEDVEKYEPMLALMGGECGMDFIKIFLENVARYLNENGVAYMEIDPQQKELIEEIIINSKNYSSCEFLNDQFGKIRVLKIIK